MDQDKLKVLEQQRRELATELDDINREISLLEYEIKEEIDMRREDGPDLFMIAAAMIIMS